MGSSFVATARQDSACEVGATAATRGGPPGDRLLAQRALRRAVEAAKGLELDAPAHVARGACDGAVDEKRRRRVRVARAADPGPVLLGQDLRAARVDEQRGVPRRQEADRRRRLRVRQRRARHVEQFVTGLAAKPPQRQALERERGRERRARKPGAAGSGRS
jgi:hypothetical protein